METIDIKSILENLGYKLYDSGPEFWMTKSLDRGPHKGLNLSISKKNGNVLDFSGGSKYTIEEFIKLNNGEIDTEKLNNFIDYNEINNNITLPKKFDKSILNHLIKDHSYWEKRGISRAICESFHGGVADSKIMPKMKNRYLIPIFNSKNEICGITARHIGNNKSTNIPKYKHLGNKKEWIWNRNNNIKDVKSVILVESPGCVMSFSECNINNVLCLFGTKISSSIISYLISSNVDNIIIATNNEPENKNIGNLAAEEIKRKLSIFFDSERIKIKLPKVKDINEWINLPGGREEILQIYS